MADRIVLNTPRFKGEYNLDFDDEPLTNIEWRWVKKITDYGPLTLPDGLRDGDPSVFVAFAVIALRRAGKIQKPEVLAVAESFDDLPFDGAAIQFIGDQEGATDDPPAGPAETPANGTPLRSIGGSSSSTSARSGSLPDGSGHPSSPPRAVDSDRAISTT